VNNFGYGGANAHIIMEDYKSFLTSKGAAPKPLTNGKHHAQPKSRVFMLSAKDEQAAITMASNLKEHIQAQIIEDEENFLDSLSYTLGQRRSVFPWVAAQPAQSIAGLIKTLETKMKPIKSSERPKIGFVFTGQGAQWHAMGRELIEAYPIYKLCILEAEIHLREFGSTWSLIGE